MALPSSSAPYLKWQLTLLGYSWNSSYLLCSKRRGEKCVTTKDTWGTQEINNTRGTDTRIQPPCQPNSRSFAGRDINALFRWPAPDDDQKGVDRNHPRSCGDRNSLPIDPNCSYSYGADDVDFLWVVLNFDQREILFNQVQPVK